MAPAEEILNEESRKYLEDVRKGKPRKFVMICKGKDIVSMVIYKKGAVKSQVVRAKETGKGAVYFGVVDGKGVNINFRLARADNFEEAPGKTIVLKQFLNDQTGDKFKPVYEIVDQHGPVLDPDDPLTARFLGLQEKALKACDENPDRAAEINQLCLQIGRLLDEDETEAATPIVVSLEQLLQRLAPAEEVKSDGLAEQFRKLKETLTPEIKSAAALPALKDPIVELLGKAKRQENAGDFAAAMETFGELEQLCRQANVGSNAASESADAKVSEAVASDFKSRLVAVVKQAKPHAARLGDQLKTLATEAQQLADQGSLSEAENRLEQLQSLVEQIEATDDQGEEKAAAAKGSFNRKLQELKPSIGELKAKMPELSAELFSQATQAIGLIREASAAAKLEKYEEACEMLTRSEPMVQALLASSSADSNPGRATDPIQIWNAAQERVGNQISSLHDALLATGDPDFRKIAEFGLNGITDRLQNEMRIALFDLQAAPLEKRGAASKKVLDVAGRFETFVNENRVIGLCDENPFSVNVSIRETLIEAISGLRESVQSA